MKRILSIGFQVFLGDVISEEGLRPKLLGPGPQTQERSISLKLLLETRVLSQSFESLINFLGFQVQQLLPHTQNLW